MLTESKFNPFIYGCCGSSMSQMFRFRVCVFEAKETIVESKILNTVCASLRRSRTRDL